MSMTTTQLSSLAQQQEGRLVRLPTPEASQSEPLMSQPEATWLPTFLNWQEHMSWLFQEKLRRSQVQTGPLSCRLGR
jgi:hypothetical protein